MPIIKVRIYAGLRMSLGWKEKPVNLDDNCRKVKCLLGNLPEVQEEIDMYMKKGYNPIILVNGRNVFLDRGLNEELKNEDIVDIFPPSAGG